jgi:antitoxin (DNA-binding transcriptional repressor) of toxin-antitoxin stability system
MHSVGIKTLKNKLSQYVRAAAGGETVLVTDRGLVVAELIAPRVRANASLVEQRLRQLMRAGLLAPAQAESAAGLPRRRQVAKAADLLHDLDLGRADR